SRRRHTRFSRDWSSDVCSSDLDSSRIAVMKAQDNGFDLAGSVLASDAYFPFRDGVDTAAEAGVSAVVQPGGSIRDEEVIAAADRSEERRVGEECRTRRNGEQHD